MTLLLDTHIFLWLSIQPQKLTPIIKAAIKSPDSRLILSVVSVWEIQIKVKIGKLNLPMPLQPFVEFGQALNNILSLPVIEQHIWTLNTLPMHHKDPFDRLIMAQAIAEDYQLVTVDSIFNRYPIALFP